LSPEPDGEWKPAGVVSQVTVTQHYPIPGLLESLNNVNIQFPKYFDDYRVFEMVGMMGGLSIDMMMSIAFQLELFDVAQRLFELGVPWTFHPDILEPTVLVQIWNEHHDAEHQWPEEYRPGKPAEHPARKVSPPVTRRVEAPAKPPDKRKPKRPNRR